MNQGLRFCWIIYLIRWVLSSHCNHTSTQKTVHDISTSCRHHFYELRPCICKCRLNICSSPHVLPQLILLCCFVLPSSGCDELPVIGSKVWSIQNMFSGKKQIKPRVQFDLTACSAVRCSVVQGRFHACSFGSDQTERSKSVDQTRLLWKALRWEAEAVIYRSAEMPCVSAKASTKEVGDVSQWLKTII